MNEHNDLDAAWPESILPPAVRLPRAAVLVQKILAWHPIEADEKPDLIASLKSSENIKGQDLNLEWRRGPVRLALLVGFRKPEDSQTYSLHVRAAILEKPTEMEFEQMKAFFGFVSQVYALMATLTDYFEGRRIVAENAGMGKARVWRYSVPSIKGEGWGILFLDDAGCFAALSDWGDWSHRWPMNGMPEGQGLREFLVDVDDAYLLGKLAPENDYDGEATVLDIKRAIIEYRRDHSGRSESVESKVKARTMWDSLEESEIFDSPHALGEWWPLHGDDMPFIPTECYQTKPNAQAVAFLKRCWPRLKACIKAELEAEKARAAS